MSTLIDWLDEAEGKAPPPPAPDTAWLLDDHWLLRIIVHPATAEEQAYSDWLCRTHPERARAICERTGLSLDRWTTCV